MTNRKSLGVGRRSFTTLLAGSVIAVPAAWGQQNSPAPPQRRGPQPEIPPFQASIEYKRREVAPKVEPFPMAQVRLLPSVFTEAQEWNRAYISRLPADRLLYNFRENAGISTGSAQAFRRLGSQVRRETRYRVARPFHGTFLERQRSTGRQRR